MIKVLAPIKEDTSDFEQMEKEILKVFREEIYLPLLLALRVPKTTLLQNTLEDLATALNKGTLRYQNGVFNGKLNAKLTKELKLIGAIWKKGAFHLPLSKLPPELKPVVAAAQHRFESVLFQIDTRLAAVLPSKVAESVKIADLFNKALWKTEKKVQDGVRNITIVPKLTTEQSAYISAKYTNNLKLYIQKFTEKETKRLRQEIQKHAFSGSRFETIVKVIKDSYRVSEHKAKFLARQETSLMMTSFKQSRYLDAGVTEYIWGCVSGTALHPVRPLHKKNQNKKFRWDDPPTVNVKGDRKNPGEDYNCRCFARPVVKF